LAFIRIPTYDSLLLRLLRPFAAKLVSTFRLPLSIFGYLCLSLACFHDSQFNLTKQYNKIKIHLNRELDKGFIRWQAWPFFDIWILFALLGVARAELSRFARHPDTLKISFSVTFGNLR